MATTWVAKDVRPEIVWAVIDCPGAYSLHGDGRGDPLLARITARVDRLPEEGERCVVAAWPLDEDGRKRHAATACTGRRRPADCRLAPALDRAARRNAGVRLERRQRFSASSTRRRPRRQRHQQPAILVVGGKEVDGDRLANRRPRRELEREAELTDPHSCTTPIGFASDSPRTSPTSRPIRSPSWKPVSSNTPRPAASTRASRSQTMKPVDGAG